MRATSANHSSAARPSTFVARVRPVLSFLSAVVAWIGVVGVANGATGEYDSLVVRGTWAVVAVLFGAAAMRLAGWKGSYFDVPKLSFRSIIPFAGFVAVIAGLVGLITLPAVNSGLG